MPWPHRKSASLASFLAPRLSACRSQDLDPNTHNCDDDLDEQLETISAQLAQRFSGPKDRFA
jgi:hypothetical protein